MMLVLGSGRASAMRAFGVFHTLLSDHMPREQVEAAESMLVSLQAVPRLCNMLAPDIPGWTGDEKEGEPTLPCPTLPCPAVLCPAPPFLTQPCASLPCHMTLSSACAIEHAVVRCELAHGVAVLCFLDNRHGLVCADVQKNRWLLTNGQQQLADVCLAAHMINKLLKRDVPPSDPLEALPTPTPAAWEGIQHSVELVLKCGAFYNSIETTLALTPVEVGLRSLQVQLTRMPYSLVAGHLPNLELDVSKIMRWVTGFLFFKLLSQSSSF